MAFIDIMGIERIRLLPKTPHLKDEFKYVITLI